jgi:hypothetical protein
MSVRMSVGAGDGARRPLSMRFAPIERTDKQIAEEQIFSGKCA